MLIVCSLPFTSTAATAPTVKISANVTNGVKDKGVSFTYLVKINGSLFNGVAKGNDGKDYEVNDGILVLPYNVTASITVNDGDNFSVQRLEYSSGKYKDVAESEVQSGDISTTSYYETINGEKKEISKSEYNNATDNGKNTSFTIYNDKDGNEYSSDKVQAFTGYIPERKTGLSTTYSMKEYSGFGLKAGMQQHTVDISDVSCSHSRASNFTAFFSHNNTLTGYFDGVADEPKTSSAKNQTSMASCKNEFSNNSIRVYSDHASEYTDQGYAVVFDNNSVVECTCRSLNKGESANGEYNNPVVKNKMTVFTEVTPTEYLYEAVEKEQPGAVCTFDVELILPTATLRVNVGTCNGTSIDGVSYYVTNSNGDVIELSGNTAQVPYDEYTLEVHDVPDNYELMSSIMSVKVVSEDETYFLSSAYHKVADELAEAVAPTCEEGGFSGNKVCAICGNILKEGKPLDALGHSYTSYEHFLDEEENHMHRSTCDNECGKTVEEACEFNYTIVTAPTYDDEGLATNTCTKCGFSYDIVLPVNTCEHNNTVVINDTPAGCGTEGYTGDTYCQDCEQIIATGETIPALEHSFTTCVPNGVDEDGVYNHVSHCDNGCGEDEINACTFEYEVTLEPGKKTEGIGTYTCTVCGQSYDEPIAALGCASITIGTDTTFTDVEVDNTIAFRYYIVINGEPYNGTVEGDDGNTYTVTDGNLVLPYNVTAIIDEIDNDTTYNIKRLAYDNEKYAYIKEAAPFFGDISTKEYFVTINGERRQVTTAEFKKATNDGENLVVDTFIDSDGNMYDDNLVSPISGYTVKRSETLGTTNYSINEYNGYYLTDTLEQHSFEISDVSCVHSRANNFTGLYSHTNSLTGYFDGVADEAKTSNSSNVLSVDLTKTNCKNNFSSNSCRVYYDHVIGFEEQGLTAVLENNSVATCGCSASSISKGESVNGEYDNPVVHNNLSVVKEVTKAVATYEAVRVNANKSCIFEAEIKPAPNGTFVIDFMIDNTAPEAFDGATFEIADEAGNILTEGVDYTLTAENKAVTIPVVNFDLGYTQYKYEGLAAGNYTITQTSTKDGYIVIDTPYAFSVSRETGEVTGENFAKSDLDGNYIALTNYEYNIANLVKIKMFKNTSITLEFTTNDQNGEHVDGAKFLMLERSATIELVKTLLKAGIDQIGSLDLQDIINQITSTDWSNLDVSTILNLLLSIVNLDFSTLEEITLPAILMSTSNSDGLVSFSNSSNILNLLDLVAGSGITGAQLADILKQYFGSFITDEMIPLLDALASMTGNINVNTGMPASTYLLMEIEVPNGYQRNPVVYTLGVDKTGSGVTNAGLLMPVIVDAVNDRFGVDLKEILINEEEFEKIKDTVGDAFDSFTDYSSKVIDTVLDTLEKILGEGSISEDNNLSKIKDTIIDYNDQYEDLAAALGETIKGLNSMITDDLSADWIFLTPRIFVDVPIDIVDCQGNTINEGITFVIKEGNNEIVVDARTANLPFGSYTIEFTYDEEFFIYENEGSNTSITIDAQDGEYSFKGVFHVINQEVYNPVEPTCTETGYTGDKVCEVCQLVISEGQDIEALGHDLSDWVVDVAETCTTDGSQHRSCSRCDYTEEEEIPATGHTFTAKVTAPTCEEQGYTTYTCDTCGYSYVDEYEDALGHTPVTDAEVAPTCTETGLTEGSHCSVCDKVLTAQQTVSALGHDYVIDEAVAPTCTETGLRAGSHCARCNEVFVTQEEIPANGHTEAIIPAVAPTCTETGLTEGKYCSVCNEELEAQTAVPANGHSFGEWETIDSPSCTASGSEQRVCTVCGFVETNAIDEAGHTWDDDYTIDIEPDCTTDGSKSIHCSRCDAIKDSVVIPANGHTEVIVNSVAPTCTATGLTESRYCSVCKLVLVEATEVAALGHDLGDWVTVKDPDCINAGLMMKFCSRCNYTEEKEIPANDHNYQAVVTEPDCENVGYTTYTCTACGDSFIDDYTLPLGHTEVVITGAPATCTESGLTDGAYCSVCGKMLIKQTVIPANGHSFGDWETVTSPNCTDKGSEKRECTVCGFAEERDVNENGHAWNEDYTVDVEPTCTTEGSKSIHCSKCDAVKDSEVIPANGHTAVTDAAVAPTCTETGLTEGSHCSVCDAVLVAQEEAPAKGHSYVADVTEPDCTNGGYTTYTCSTCGDSFVDDYTDANGHTVVTDAAVAPTCTETGLTEGSHCSVCDAVLTEQEEVPANGHTAVTDEAVAPTCTETGLTEGSHCSVCDAVLTEQEEVPANGHTAVTDAAVAPTCTETGLTEGSHCSLCDAVLTAQEEVPANGHTAVTDEAVAPTCTETGLTEGTHCSVCDTVLVAQEEVPANGHTAVTDEAVAPTCTETGLTEGSHCSVCGTVLTAQEVVAPIGHDWDDGVITTAPTTEAEGVKTYTCKDCGATYTEPVAKLPVTVIETPAQIVSGAGGTLSFEISGSIDEILAILVDGTVLTDDCYTLDEETKTVELTQEFLDTLEVGTHILGIESTSGLTESEFEILAPEEPTTEPTTEEPTTEPTTKPTTEPTTKPETTKPDTTKKEETTKKNHSLTSPETGASFSVATATTALAGVFAMALLLKKKNEED